VVVTVGRGLGRDGWWMRHSSKLEQALALRVASWLVCKDKGAFDLPRLTGWNVRADFVTAGDRNVTCCMVEAERYGVPLCCTKSSASTGAKSIHSAGMRSS
jgi:hypothetical protein